VQFYYISVAVARYRVHVTWYGVRGPVAQPAITKFVGLLKLLLQLKTRL